MAEKSGKHTAGISAWLLLLAVLLTGCGETQEQIITADPPPLVIGMVAGSAANPVFLAARAGAEDAAAAWSERAQRPIRIDWRTPGAEDAPAQAEAIDALAAGNAAGILVSCSDAELLTPHIDAAVVRGSAVVCFAADAPASRRLAYCGSDNSAAGRELTRQLARVMNNRGLVAILGGNRSAPGMQQRVNAARAELMLYPRMAIAGEYYHAETPAAAVAALQAAQRGHPEIEGWLMVGGWPFFAGAPAWLPGNDKVVAMDALPEQLAAVADGRVQALVAQNCHQWGQRGVGVLLAALLNGEIPANPLIYDELRVVTSANVAALRLDWERWLAAGASGRTGEER